MNKVINTDTDTRGVVTLTLNNPGHHHALSGDLIAVFLDELRVVHESKSTRVVIVAATGDTFCSGGDLKQMLKPQGEYASQLELLMRQLYLCPVPTVARVQGPAYGGGAGLICCCDYAIAASESQIALTETRLGLIPAIISPYLITAIGSRQAKQLMMSGEKIDAVQAYQLGLFSHVVPKDALDNVVSKLIEKLLLAGPEAVKQCKRLTNRIIDFESIRNLDTANWLAETQSSNEAREGITAFFEKRSPAWVSSGD